MNVTPLCLLGRDHSAVAVYHVSNVRYGFHVLSAVCAEHEPDALARWAALGYEVTLCESSGCCPPKPDRAKMVAAAVVDEGDVAGE